VVYCTHFVAPVGHTGPELLFISTYVKMD